VEVEKMKRKIVASALFMIGAMVLFGGCSDTTSSTARTTTTNNVVHDVVHDADSEVVLRPFQVSSFDGLEIGGGSSFVVVFRQSNNIAVYMELQEDLFDFYEVYVSRGTLHLERSDIGNTLSVDHRPRVYIYAPYLTAINVRGALHTEDWEVISTPNFSITSNGFVSLSAPLEVDALELHLNGASELTFWGYAHNATITKNGAGSIMAVNLQTANTTISLNGAGDIEIAVSDNLDATLGGVGSIRYIGNPAIVQYISRGAVGSISRVE